MDFFTTQENARRRTWWLICLFFAAIAGIIATTYLVVMVIFQTAMREPSTQQQPSIVVEPMLNMPMLLLVGGAVSLIVLGSSAFKLMQLKKGGDKIAEMLGGRKIDPASTQYHERRLLNIVEEMALASGVPVPPVYLIVGQKGINAFAAGYSIHDAVIGVTEGTMRGLKREELQGVIAHEYSHILNGDMRLNIRLMGVLHGLLVLAIIGRILLYSSGSRRRVSTNSKNNGAALIIALGLALMVIGYFGYFFGGLIKRAVSRQREYLADASAVQFTRDTRGLSNALKKIGGLTTGGRIKHDHAEELSHMFFADGMKRFFGAGSIFATHPPLQKRIQALDPSFDGDFPMITEDSLYISAKEDQKPSPDAGKEGPKKSKSPLPDILQQDALLGGVAAGGATAVVLQQIGVLDAMGQAIAQHRLESLPKELCDAVHEPLGAQAFVLALLIGRAEEDSADAWTWVPTGFIDSVGRLMELAGRVGREEQLMLLEMSSPALRTLGKEQAKRLIDIMQQIINADQVVNLFEFTVGEIVQSSLRHTLELPVPRVHISRLQDVHDEVALLLSAIAAAGTQEADAAAKAFDAGAGVLAGVGPGFEFKEQEARNTGRLKEALATLRETTMPVRKKILEACLTCLLADRTATSTERELFRSFACALEVPVPIGTIDRAQVKSDAPTDD